MPTKAGPAKPVQIVTDNRPRLGPVMPVYLMDDTTLDRVVEAGAAQPIVVVTEAEIAALGLEILGTPVALPIYAVSDRLMKAGPAQLVLNLAAAVVPPAPVPVTVNIVSSTADARVRGAGAVYATARSTSTEQDAGGTESGLGQAFGGAYEITRLYFKFDTSVIPDDATIQAVTLTLTLTADGSTTDFDVVIRKQNWSAQDPITAGNREAAYDGTLAAASDSSIWRNTSGLSINTPYASGPLDVTHINKTGNTYYSLVSSRDIAANVPVGDEFVVVAFAEHATAAFRPTLNVTYLPAS